MRRSLWLCLLLSVLIVGAASQAFAQMGEDNTQKCSLYGGLYMPSGSVLRDMGSSVWKVVGLGLNLKQDQFGRPGGCINLEYMTDKQDFFSGSRMSLTYVKLYHKPVKEEHVHGPYYGIGGGVNFVSSKIAARPFLFPPVVGSDESGIQPSVMLIGGYDLSENFYAEIRYTKMPQLSAGADFSGLMLSVGTRSVF